MPKDTRNKTVGKPDSAPVRPFLPQNSQDIFCDPDLDGLEFYHATYVGHMAKTHSHKEYTIGVIDAGKRGYTQNGEKLIATPKSILLINGDTPHDGFPVDTNPWRCRAFYPTKEMLKKYLGLGEGERPFPNFPKFVVRDDIIYDQFDAFFDLVENSRFALEKQTAFVGLIEDLIARFSDNSVEPETMSNDDTRVIRALEKYLQERFAENLSLGELGLEADYNPNALVRFFKSKTGYTPHSYLMDLRLKAAKDLLQQGLAPAKVAVSTGFFDEVLMHDYFQQVLGMSPAQYQAACRNK